MALLSILWKMQIWMLCCTAFKYISCIHECLWNQDAGISLHKEDYAVVCYTFGRQTLFNNMNAYTCFEFPYYLEWFVVCHLNVMKTLLHGFNPYISTFFWPCECPIFPVALYITMQWSVALSTVFYRDVESYLYLWQYVIFQYLASCRMIC